VFGDGPVIVGEGLLGEAGFCVENLCGVSQADGGVVSSRLRFGGRTYLGSDGKWIGRM
jgi:hypothetical protein